MKEKIKKVYKYLIVFMLLIMMAPLNVFASHDSSGKPENLEDRVYVAIYNGEGFPGEPAIYGTSLYTNFNSNFERTNYTQFSSSAENIFKESIISKLVQGAASGTQKVWGLYDANGTRDYLADNSPLLIPENELKIIKAITNNQNATLDEYEIVWYVIKYQSGSGFFSVDDWHIDGIVKEKNTYSVNYYGNGNTSGSAPLGVTGINPGGSYEVVGNTGNLIKEIAGINYPFIGWSTNPNSTSPEYKAGDLITNINSNISLYAIFDNHIDYLVKVNTYLDNELVDMNDIISGNTLYLKKSSGNDYISLNRDSEGKYSTSIPTGTYNIWIENNNAYSMIHNHQLIVDNDTEEINLHYYSVSYNTNGGNFKDNENPGTVNYFTGDSVTATSYIPEREGYIFAGWNYNNSVYEANAVVTSSINNPIVLEANWVKLINIKLNVKINHIAENGDYDDLDTKDDLIVQLLRKNKGNNPYIETGLSISFSDLGVSGFNYIPTYNGEYIITTEYKATQNTFTSVSNLYDYTITTSKSGYDVIKLENLQDPIAGDWTINVELEYNPSDFDLDFSISMDEDVPKVLYPNAVIVKIAHYVNGSWQLVPQQIGNVPGVRVDINKTTGTGTGTYPVMKYVLDSNNLPDTNNPYGYRIIVTAFVYQDGKIVPVTNQNIAAEYTDDNYKAVIGDVSDGKLFGTLNGAYYGGEEDQIGTLDAIVTVLPYTVTFDAKGGTVNGKSTDVVNNVYQVPSFDDYVPTRENYEFKGWYLDESYVTPGSEYAYLTSDITLYAKWNPIQNLTGSIIIDGTYIHSNATVEVWERDLPTHVTVILQELIKGPSGDIEHIHNIDSQEIEIDWNSEYTLGTSKTNYMFTGLDGSKTYRIDVLLVNFKDRYQNKNTVVDATAPIESNYNLVDYIAVYKDDLINTFVNVYLDFDAEDYFQIVEVDSSAIGEGFRPSNVHAQIEYKLIDEYDDSYNIISQHTVEPFGLNIGINLNGMHNAIYGEYVWKAMWNGKLYIYQALLKDATINSNQVLYDRNAPYTVSYGVAAGWNPTTQSSSGPLKIIITPNTYNIIFDLNTTETITNMDSYLIEDEYKDTYTWSFGKEITASPSRTGYKFLGWTIKGTTEIITQIDPSRHGDITLKANWEKDESQTKKVSYTVEHKVDGIVKDTKTHEKEIWINADTELEVQINTLKPNTYTGYKFKEVINNIKEGDIVSDGTVITLVYDKDESQTKKVSYTVEHKVDGIVKDTKTHEKEIWINADAELEVQTNTLKPNTYTGYKFKEVINNIKEGDIVTDGTVITLVYDKDDSQTKKVTYTVEHKVDGIVKDTKTHEKEIWINADAELEVQTNTLKPNTYTGYKFKEVINNIKEGDIVTDSTVITLVYEKDTYTYIVEYYYDDIKDDSKTETLSAIYQTVIDNYTDKLEDNYVLEKIVGLPLTISAEISNNVIKVYYATDEVGGGTDGEESDQIPDKYQKKIIFKIINGTWNENNKDIIKYVTLLDKDGNHSIDGAASIEIPSNMKANDGYDNGKWDVVPTSIVRGTNDEVYTYSYEKIICEEENPKTHDGIGRSIIMVIISQIGLIITVLYLKKEKNSI